MSVYTPLFKELWDFVCAFIGRPFIWDKSRGCGILKDQFTVVCDGPTENLALPTEQDYDLDQMILCKYSLKECLTSDVHSNVCQIHGLDSHSCIAGVFDKKLQHFFR